MAPNENKVRAAYRKLLNCYPRDFREQMGVSMEQTFVDLYKERMRDREQGMFGFVVWMFAETSLGIIKEYITLTTQGVTMKTMFTSPKSAAIISGIICLPFAFLFTLLMLNIEPNFGPLQPLLRNADPDQPDVLGSLIALGTLLLVIAAFILNLKQIMRTVRGGGGLMAYRVNLVLAVVTLAVIGMVVGAILVDQYPCWMGVPNCD